MSGTGMDFKVILLGHKSVGKTSLFNRYVYGEWGDTQMTIGAYFAQKTVPLADEDGGGECNLAIWDTAGEEKFDSLTNFYCRSARAAIVCYDVTQPSSFQGLMHWIEKIESDAAPNCVLMIVGNKCDIVNDNASRRGVSTDAARKFAEEHGAGFMEVSAKTGGGVQEAFDHVVDTLVQQMVQKRRERAAAQQQGGRDGGVKLGSGGSGKKEGGCC